MTTINRKPLNNSQFNSTSVTVDGTASGSILKIQQSIKCKYVGSVLGITQNIHFLATQATKALFSVQQQVVSKQAQTPVLHVTQMIISP